MHKKWQAIFIVSVALTLFIAVLFFFSRQTFAQAAQYAPTSDYSKESREGFTILINKALLRSPQQYQEFETELTTQLNAIGHAVPAKPLAALKNVTIWVELDHAGGAEFHPSKQWLIEHGYNPEKAGCIEISNARNFVEWSMSTQPWMILHELAHAYHMLVLGADYAGIEAAYENALNKQLYTSVAYIGGGNRRAYALNDNKEYFAELSEAYFGKNDFYPFTRADLKQYDPVGYKLMEEVWRND